MTKNILESKPEEVKICGKKKDEIRKYYFSGKLGQLLTDIQAEAKWDTEDFNALKFYLEELKQQNDVLITTFGSVELVDTGEQKPPSLDELQKGVDDQEWREKANAAGQYIKNVLDSTRGKIARREKIDSAFWLNTSTIFLSYIDLIDKDYIYQKQLYHAKIIRIMHEFKLSRKASEDYAKTTIEYSNYKNLELLKERINEFINLSKYYDKKQG